jgi:hypothetical protein
MPRAEHPATGIGLRFQVRAPNLGGAEDIIQRTYNERSMRDSYAG